MTHHAKAPSAGSTQATGSSRGLFRRALATRAASRGSKGSGAPAARLLGLLAISLIALFATAAPASAAIGAKMETISNVSYASAEVSGKVTPSGSTVFATYYSFQYSKDPVGEGWTPGIGGEFPGGTPNQEVTVNKVITGLKGGTKYFVRLTVTSFLQTDAIDPPDPGPYPSFTTLPVEQPTIVATDDASEVFSTSAKATGKVKRPANGDPAFDITKCRFEYVTDANFGATGFAGAATQDCAEPLNNAPNGETTVSAALTGLEPTTTYHLRLAVENAAPGVVTKEAASTFTTAAKVAPPTVTATDDASEIDSNSATFTGKVQRPDGDDPALDTDCRFEYITDAQFLANEGIGDPGFNGASSVDCVENTIKSTGETPVSAHAGVAPDTTYHLRLVAENGGGSDAKDAASTFTTPEADKPAVILDPVAGGTYTTAHLSGTVEIDDPGYTEVASRFQISTDNVNWSHLGVNCGGLIGTLGSLLDCELDVTDLQPSTTYFFRYIASYRNYDEEAIANGEVVFSSTETITTEPLSAPTAEDLEVTNITATGAHFSAIVDPHAPAGPLSELGRKAFATHWEFVCTPECKDANGNTIGGTVQGEEGAQAVGGDAKRLETNTPYEVSLIISSEGGGETVGPVPFATPLIKPTVKAAPGASDGKGGYTIQGVVNPNGSEVTDCKFEWGPNSAELVFSADCSPAPGAGSKPVSVEAHLTGLNPGVVYHYNLFATNAAGEEESGPQEFIPTLNPPETCANEQQRTESNSLALPECRAYEKVSPSGKEGFDAGLAGYFGGDRVRYESGAGNIARSGSNSAGAVGGGNTNSYVANRTAAGWETIPNLNGASGNVFDAPSELVLVTNLEFLFPRFYSPDLLSSLWSVHRKNGPIWRNLYLRSPDGHFTLVGSAKGRYEPQEKVYFGTSFGPSADLSHVITWAAVRSSAGDFPSEWGPGVYEFVGTGGGEPRRVDLDNSGSPISTCTDGGGVYGESNSVANASSADGRVIAFTAFGGCGGANPPADEIWARVNGTTAFDVSASQCDRVAPAPACNAPAKPTFEASTPDGSRVFFTTTQQLIDADTDQAKDIYACDIPSGNPAPSAGKANHCAAFMQVSGAQTGANVERFLASSENGSTVLFTAKGKLADNEDARGEEALAGDHNLYLWRTDAAHPTGQTTFLGRLDSVEDSNGFAELKAQSTPDGRYLAFTTASQLLDTDTDSARDVYRYASDTGELARASTNVFGVAGNGEGSNAQMSLELEHHPTTAISDDGQKIVFATDEALSAADGNGEADVYLWTPARVSLISAGAVGSGGGGPVITASGQDIYFNTRGALTPADGDDISDVYDARIGGGFSFAPKPVCMGEGCQPPSSPLPPISGSPANTPNGEGNVKSKSCPKGKVAKGDKCVKKKKPKKHSGKKRRGKKAAHKQGGEK